MLMQKTNQAYAANDLLALVLQLQIEDVRDAVLLQPPARARAHHHQPTQVGPTAWAEPPAVALTSAAAAALRELAYGFPVL